MTEIPSGWAVTTIGEIAHLENGRAFKPSDWSKTGIPIIRIQNLNNGSATFNHFSGEIAQKHIVHDGDLLFAWSGTPGTSFGAHIWRGPMAALNQHIFNIRVDERFVSREFLKIAINAKIDEQIAKAHGGAGLQHVTKGAFERTEILLPPLGEQLRIIEKLKNCGERIATIRAKLENIRELSDRIGSIALESAYNGDLSNSNDGNETSRVTVGEVAIELQYGSSAKSKKHGDVPVLRMGNIQKGEVDWSDLAFTSDTEEITKYLLRTGDVLFNRTNSPALVGKTAIYRGDRPAIFAGYIIRIQCSDRINPEFLTYCLNSPSGREYCRRVKSDGVSQSNINAKKLAAFSIPCPTETEQELIVSKIKVARSRVDVLDEKVKEVERMLDIWGRALTNSGLLGGLNTLGTNDEPAKLQIERLAEHRKAKRHERAEAFVVGVQMEKKSVKEILGEADNWLSVEEIARRYGIVFGTETEEIEPFFEEIRRLDIEGRIAVEPQTDSEGRKISERMRWREL